jgi:cysteinyl-tRNA synthetase
MTLRLYNTLTRRKEDFAPLDASNVRMYVCGPTVYDFAHIGNARPVIVFDVLFRLLRHLYGAEHVTYVRNITDIDDKINARAAELASARGIAVEAARAEITAGTAKQYEEDVAALGCLPPTHTPRATQYVAQMIAMIQTLIASGHAYAAEGHVLYDVSSKQDYGKLARRSLDEMIAGARVDPAPYKKNPMDFVLWKPSDDLTPGWESPWGRGRPGWHIECSAMGEALLGETFDIHGGGIDLMFPHHENEIAQSEGAHRGHALARIWMHNGFLQVEGEKMSKSLGNFFTIRELLNKNNWDGEALRLNMLMTHYRQPINWTLNRVVRATRTLDQWYDLIGEVDVDVRAQHTAFDNYRLENSLCDDLNIHLLLDSLHQRAETLSREKISSGVEAINSELAEFKAAANFLGLLTRKESDWDALKLRMTNEAAIAAAIMERRVAKAARDFKKADEIRDELLAQGIVLKDNADGTTSWEVKR